jgi:hypothetical protein
MSIKTFSLPLGRFVLEFDVDIELSVQYTCQFRHHGPNFLFAVAEVWMSCSAGRYLLYPKSNPGNFLEDLASIAVAISNPPSIQNMEAIIDCGGWCAWMAAYWDRVDADSVVADDELNFEKLIRLSMLESRMGHLAIYRCGGSPIIEAATRSDDLRNRVTAWDFFESEFLRARVDEVARDMADAIRRAL